MGLIDIRRRLFMQKATGLPTAYTALEYLQSSGTQVIDTGKYGKFNSRFIADCLLMPGTQSTYAAIFGCSNPSIMPFSNMGVEYPSPITTYSSFGNVNDISSDRAILPYFRMILTLDKNSGVVVYAYSDIDSLKSTATLNATSFTENPNSHICLFARGNNGTYERFAKCRIYEYWHYEGDILVQHMIPVKRNSDNKPGMYDTVSWAFYTNAGTGEFIVPEN